MLHLSAWTELLVGAWLASALTAAALLDSDNRAGTGLLLGLAGGPLGLVVAYRMHLAALAGSALPRDGRYGAMISAYLPPRPRAAAALAWPAILAAVVVVYILARERYGTWIGYPLILVGVLLAMRLRAGPEEPVVAVFDQGIVIGPRFIAWRDLQEIEHYPNEPQNPADGTELWVFNRKHGAIVRLRVPAASYVNALELNALLQARAPLRVVTPRPSA